MGLETAVLSQIATAATIVGTVASVSESQKAKSAQKKAKEAQAAQNYSEQMAERRRQIREERIKRARIAQASEGSGVSSSSGELGAIGGMSTQLSSNLGSNLDRVFTSNQITGYLQEASDAKTAASNWSIFSDAAPVGVSLAGSIFQNNDSDPLGEFIKQKGIG